MAFDLLARIQALRAQSAISRLSTSAGAAMVGADDGAAGAQFSTAQGFLDRLRSSQGAGSVGFIQPFSGANPAVISTVQAKLRESWRPAKTD